MQLNEYQDAAMSTCMESCDNHSYMFYGLMGEAGELMGKIAKFIRKGKIGFNNNSLIDLGLTEEDKKGLKSEVGDCAWFLAGICKTLGWTLEEVCEENRAKLADRKKRGVIEGSGDFR